MYKIQIYGHDGLWKCTFQSYTDKLQASATCLRLNQLNNNMHYIIEEILK